MSEDETPGDRFRAARERAGMTEDEVATQASLPVAWYRDLEHDPSEIWSNVSLDSLYRVCEVLGLTLRGILDVENKVGVPSIAPSQLATTIQHRIRAEETDPETWGDRVGWDVKPILTDPMNVERYTLDALRDICGALNLDWRAVLRPYSEKVSKPMISADDIEAEFRANALVPGAVLILSVHDAIAMIARAKELNIPILGVNGFRLSSNSVQPDTGLTLDCSNSTTGCWQEAEK